MLQRSVNAIYFENIFYMMKNIIFTIYCISPKTTRRRFQNPASLLSLEISKQKLRSVSSMLRNTVSCLNLFLIEMANFNSRELIKNHIRYTILRKTFHCFQTPVFE